MHFTLPSLSPSLLVFSGSFNLVPFCSSAQTPTVIKKRAGNAAQDRTKTDPNQKGGRIGKKQGRAET